MMKKYKFIHIIWANEFKFSRPLIELFNKYKDVLHSEEHLFVTMHKKVYQELGKNENFILDDSNCNLFNKYAPMADYIISHDFPGKKIVFGTKRKYQKKIVYRYWGGRRYLRKKEKGHLLHNIYSSLYNTLYKLMFRYIYDNLALIGIANIVDEIDLGGLIRKTPMMRMPYPNSDAYEIIQTALKNQERNESKLRVVIGHRSEPIENHIRYIELLSKFPVDKIEMYLPLSYGNKEYAEKVCEYVKEKDLKNVITILDFMNFRDYVEFLSNMDIAIIDCDNSLALGNVSLNLSLNNTIYLSRNGVIKKAFDKERIPCRCVEEIANMSFEEFSSLINARCFNGASLKRQPMDYYVNLWKEVLDYLKSIH